MGKMVETMDEYCVGAFDGWDRAWLVVGVLRAWMGWMVVLGSGRKRVFHALACRNRVNPLACSYRETWRVQVLDRIACTTDIHPLSCGCVFSSVGRTHERACVRD